MTLDQVLDYVMEVDTQQRGTLTRVLQPLYDCTREELDVLAEAVQLGAARTMKGPITQGMQAQRVLDDVRRLLLSVRWG